MKIIALNSSARVGGESKTEILLDPLVQGMRDAGAEVEVINLKDKKIKTCVGCYTCWTKTPGVCVHQDDMTKELFPKWVESDLCVYATPLFFHTVNATLKRFLERTLPVAEPFMIQEKGRWTHPLRFRSPRVVVLSVAGFPEESAFGALKDYARFLWGARGNLMAEIYRTGAESLPMARAEVRDDVLAAMAQAGRELVELGRVEPATMDRITQPLVETEDLARLANTFWRTAIAAGVTPREFGEKGMIPHPESIEEFLSLMSVAFNPAGAVGAAGTIQFDFNGDVQGSGHLTIADGRLQAQVGPAAAPDLTITVALEDWYGIMTGRLDPQQLLVDGRMKPVGELSLMMRVQTMFGG
jgi:multimeric flavodoxin WrbA